MDLLQTSAVVIFWAGAALAIYTYIGYPILISVLSRVFGVQPRPPVVAVSDLPSVSLLIAAYNEEAVIARRIETALATDYPADRFEIVVASDGSSDHTAEIIRSYACQGVHLLDFKERRGKATVLNEIVPKLRGDIVLLSDANTEVEPDATRLLARWFADKSVGAVCGQLLLHDARTSRNVDGLYWRYENHLKRCDARLGGLLGANGAIYAIRKDLFSPIPRGTTNDDLVIPLQAKLLFGSKIIYDWEAVAHEDTAPDVSSEFRRRSRIGVCCLLCVGLLWRLLNPANGWVALTFFSHKICRWVCPFAMLSVLICNLALLDRPFYQSAIAAQAFFYIGAGMAALLPGRSKVVRLLRMSSMFVGMNAALLVGICNSLAGRQKVTWKRTTRTAEIAGAETYSTPARGVTGLHGPYQLPVRHYPAGKNGNTVPKMSDIAPGTVPIALTPSVSVNY